MTRTSCPFGSVEPSSPDRPPAACPRISGVIGGFSPLTGISGLNTRGPCAAPWEGYRRDARQARRYRSMGARTVGGRAIVAAGRSAARRGRSSSRGAGAGGPAHGWSCPTLVQLAEIAAGAGSSPGAGRAGAAAHVLNGARERHRPNGRGPLAVLPLSGGPSRADSDARRPAIQG